MDKFMLNMYNYLNGYLERNHSNISKLDREDIAQVATQGGYDEYSENCDEVNALAVAVDICEKLVSDISEVSDKNMSVFAQFLPEDILENEELLRTVRLEIWEKLLDSSKKAVHVSAVHLSVLQRRLIFCKDWNDLWCITCKS